MGKPVIHFEVNATDAKVLQGFYGQLFDWKINADNEWNYGIVDTGGEGGINGGIGPNPEATGITFYVQVDDLQAYLDKAESLGAKTLMPPTEIPGAVTLAMFADPEGNRVGMIKG